MPTILEHFNQVMQEEVSCTSNHDDDFAELLGTYHQAEDFLDVDLATDVNSGRIYIRGSVHAPGTIIIDFDDMPGDDALDNPRVTVERWAEKDGKIAYVSKTGNITPQLAANYIDNRFQWFRSISEARRNRIASAALAAPEMCLWVFKGQRPVSDVTFAALRDNVRYAYNKFPDPTCLDTELESTNPLYTGNHYLTGAKLPEGYLTQSKGRERLAAFGFMSDAAIAALPADEQSRRLECGTQYILHVGGHELTLATSAIARVANIVRTGRALSPAVPQSDLRRFDKMDKIYE